MIGKPGRMALTVPSRVTRARNMALVLAGSTIPKNDSIRRSSLNIAEFGGEPAKTCLAMNLAKDRSNA